MDFLSVGAKRQEELRGGHNSSRNFMMRIDGESADPFFFKRTQKIWTAEGAFASSPHG